MAARSSSKPAWQATWLWKTLERRKAKGSPHASEILPILEIWLGKLEVVLRGGGTVPLDFTLHDDRHAFRVSTRMEELLSPAVRKNISDYEVALLLLAAYGHDVGMAPERGKVAALRNHLFAPDESTLAEQEKERFQKFLDEYAERPVVLPLSSNPADLALADELIAYYVRGRHNDWSAEWLRENLLPSGFPHVADIVEILIRLCSSHHWDFERLRKDDFNPLLSSGAQPQIIHLRYLACILRLADILENDPERTPVVLLRHRSIAERKKSLVHWQKDHAFTIDLLDDGRLRFHARSPDAHIHRALLELAGWIDHELQGIAAFGESLPTEKKVGNATIRRDWHLAPALTPDIKPADGSYEYIDGAFRPNTGRLLQLLSGEQLYENPLHGVRELLQNAFDAVREKIARKRIEPLINDPADRKWEKILGDQEQVSLTLRPGSHDEWLLVCEDSGVGLTKDLITGHLLVSGTGRRHAILDLERQCAEKGFHPGLTGQFGIGVLSYFMLAEEVTLETTRFQGCGDGVENWHFTTRGVGSFGELRKPLQSPFLAGGTRITWTFRKDRIEDPEEFAIELLDYLKDTLIRIPCRFTFKVVGIPSRDLSWTRGTGWTMTEDDWRDLSISEWLEPEVYIELEMSKSVYPSEAERSRRDKHLESYPDKLASAKNAFRCCMREVKLDGVGFARLISCWFELEHGRSLEFPRERADRDLFSIPKYIFRGWKGMSLGERSPFSRSERSRGTLALSFELDFEEVDRAKLSINRNGVKFPDHAENMWTDEIWRVGNEWLDEQLTSGEGDYYHEVNQRIRRLPLTLKGGRAWYFRDEKNLVRPLPPNFAALPGNYSPSYGRTQDGKLVPFIAIEDKELRKAKVGFKITMYSGKLSGGLSSNDHVPILCHHGEGATADLGMELFPKEWKDVAMVELLGGTNSLNSENVFARLLTLERRLEIVQRSAREDVFLSLDNTTTATDFAAILFRIAQQMLGHNRFDVRRWERYLSERGAHFNSLWQQLAKETKIPLDGLRFGALNTWKHVVIQASPPANERMFKTGRQLFPRITDPGFLLFDSDNDNGLSSRLATHSDGKKTSGG